MSGRNRQEHLAAEIDRVIDYFRKEFDMTYADAIGVMTIMVVDLALECNQRQQELDEDESGST